MSNEGQQAELLPETVINKLDGVGVRTLPMVAVVDGLVAKFFADNNDAQVFRGDVAPPDVPGMSGPGAGANGVANSLMAHMVQSVRLDYATAMYRATRDIPLVDARQPGTGTDREAAVRIAPVPMLAWGAATSGTIPAITFQDGLDTIKAVMDYVPKRQTREYSMYQALLNIAAGREQGRVDQTGAIITRNMGAKCQPTGDAGLEAWAFSRAHHLDVMMMAQARMPVPTDWVPFADDCYNLPSFGSTHPTVLPTAFRVRGSAETRYVTGTIARVYGERVADRFKNVTLEGAAIQESLGSLFARFRAPGWVALWDERGEDAYDGVPLPAPTFIGDPNNTMQQSGAGLHGGQAWSLVTALAWQASWHRLLGSVSHKEWSVYGDDQVRWRRSASQTRAWFERDLIAKRMLAVALQPAIMLASLWGRLLRSPLLAEIIERWGDKPKVEQTYSRLARIESLKVDPIFRDILKAYATTTTETPWGPNPVVTMDPVLVGQLFEGGLDPSAGSASGMAGGWLPPGASARISVTHVTDVAFRPFLRHVEVLERLLFHSEQGMGASLAEHNGWLAQRLGWVSLPGDNDGTPFRLSNDQPVFLLADGTSRPPVGLDAMRHVLHEEAAVVQRAPYIYRLPWKADAPPVPVHTNTAGESYMELSSRISPLDFRAFHSPVQNFGDRVVPYTLSVDHVRRLGRWDVDAANEGDPVHDPLIADMLRNPGVWGHLLQLEVDPTRPGRFLIVPARTLSGAPAQFMFRWPGARVFNKGVTIHPRCWLPRFMAIVAGRRVIQTAEVYIDVLTGKEPVALRSTWGQIADASKGARTAEVPVAPLVTGPTA